MLHSNWVEIDLLCGGGCKMKVMSSRVYKFAQVGQYNLLKFISVLTDQCFGSKVKKC